MVATEFDVSDQLEMPLSAMMTPLSACWTLTGTELPMLSHSTTVVPLSVCVPWFVSFLDAITVSGFAVSSTKSAATSVGFTSWIASGSEPLSVVIARADTRACALIAGTRWLLKNHGRLASVALTSRNFAAHGGPAGSELLDAPD